jgi:hypothetical protein
MTITHKALFNIIHPQRMQKLGMALLNKEMSEKS